MTSLHDASVLRRIAPQSIEAFLSSLGWAKVHLLEGRGSIWQVTVDDKPIQVVVPRSRDFADYVRRVQDVLFVLEGLTGTAAKDLVLRMTTALDDIAYLSLDGPDVSSGTIPISDGQAFFSSALELLKAATASLIDPRPFYPTRKPSRVDQYVKQVRFGQTTVGSYQIRLISKHLALPVDFGVTKPPEPFERKAIVRLLSSVDSLVQASYQAQTENSLDAFSASVDEGVSADLCKAVLGMCNSSKRRDLHIDVVWSESLGPPPTDIGPTDVSRDLIDTIKQGYDFLRTATEIPDVEIMGYVTRLHREADGDEGDATIVATFEGKPRKIKVKDMSLSLYNRALSAHASDSPLRIRGTLQRVGVYYELTGAKWKSEEED